MKKWSFTIIVLTFLLSFCEKQEDNKIYWGEATANKNGNNWIADPYASDNVFRSQNINLRIHIFNSNNELREKLLIIDLPKEVSDYKILYTDEIENNQVVSARYTTFCCDGDVVEDRFIVLDNDTNYIELTSINSETGEIKGNFEVTFVRDPDDDVTNASLPDTIHFTDGTFNTKISDE